MKNKAIYAAGKPKTNGVTKKGVMDIPATIEARCHVEKQVHEVRTPINIQSPRKSDTTKGGNEGIPLL